MEIEKLKLEQQKLAEKVIITDTKKSYDIIAGADQAYLDNDTIITAIVVIDAKTKEILDRKYTIKKCGLKYIPGFLSYRESPAFIETYYKLSKDFDVMMIEGNGILHPRKIGIASHIGISINKPTIGIAKNLLCGEIKGNSVYVDKEVVGKVMKPFDYTKELYVSPGHMITPQKSFEIVKSWIIKPYKLPYPVAMANKYVKKIKKRQQKEPETISEE